MVLEPRWGQDTRALVETAYLVINLFLLIIYLDNARHLKKRGDNSKDKKSSREAGAGVYSTGRLANNSVCVVRPRLHLLAK